MLFGGRLPTPQPRPRLQRVDIIQHPVVQCGNLGQHRGIGQHGLAADIALQCHQPGEVPRAPAQQVAALAASEGQRDIVGGTGRYINARWISIKTKASYFPIQRG